MRSNYQIVEIDDNFIYEVSKEIDTANYTLTVNRGDDEHSYNWDEVCLSKDRHEIELKIRNIRYHLDGECDIELHPKAARALGRLLIQLADEIAP